MGSLRIFSIFLPVHLKNKFSRNSIRFSSTKMVKAVVVLAPGAEELEFVGSVDILRRAGVSFLFVIKISKNTLNIDYTNFRLMSLLVD
jgi:hypothetical protein